MLVPTGTPMPGSHLLDVLENHHDLSYPELASYVQVAKIRGPFCGSPHTKGYSICSRAFVYGPLPIYGISQIKPKEALQKNELYPFQHNMPY